MTSHTSACYKTENPNGCAGQHNKEFLMLFCTAQPTEVFGPHLHANYTGLLTELNDFSVIFRSPRSVLRSY
jgi:hypothetical protein